MSLAPLFAPRSVAVVGASPDPGRPGGIVLRNLRAFRGRLYPVNPHHREIGGLPSFPTLSDLPEPVDLAVLLRPAAELPRLLAEQGDRIRCAVVVSAGFAETGAVALQEELLRVARERGVRILGPNCLGVYNPYQRLDTLFLPRERLRRPRKGNVAIVAQSGALLVCLLEALARAGQGISCAVNYGNAADIDAAELFDHLAADPRTEVVVAYLEAVGEGRRFLATARQLANRKPLLVLKGGKGAGGQAAACSHTGRLAGRYDVFTSLLRQEGIQEVTDLDALLDATLALARQRPRPGRRVAIVTNAGGLGVLAADECGRQWLELTPLPPAVRERLQGVFPAFYTVANPIDLTGQVRDEEFRTVLAALGDAYDGFLIIAHSGVAGVGPGLAAIVSEFHHAVARPVVVCLPPGGIAGQLGRALQRGGIPVYPTPERGVRGLQALLAGEGAP